MKLLNKLAKKPKTDQITSWLLHIRRVCRNHNACISCEYMDDDTDGCKIYFIVSMFMNNVLVPGAWKLENIKNAASVRPVKPASLDFLNHIHWDNDGNPVVIS